MRSVRRTSNTRSRGCFVKKFYDLPGANLSHTKERLECGVLPDKMACLGTGFVPGANLSPAGECPEKGHSPHGFEVSQGKIVEADALIYEVVEKYLNGLILELNLRLFCDVELEAGYFPQKILWVEEITMRREEVGTSVCEPEEKYCSEGRLLKEEKEAVFSEQIKYMLEKIKNYFKTLWKKKGR